MKTKDKKKLARVIATWVVTGIMLSVFILDIITIALDNKYVSELNIVNETFTEAYGVDRLHFLNTANSDCILIESNGHFALIDSGEGNKNPRRKTEYKGFEEEVLTYIKKTAADKSGNVTLDFIVATHMHYDHAGNFVTIINDPNIQIKKAYIKEYSEKALNKLDDENWGNGDLYRSIIKALNGKSIPVISNLPSEAFRFEDFTCLFVNTNPPDYYIDKGENANSIGVKITKGEKSAFLAADITADTGAEEICMEAIGDIDLLKIGHHGYIGSSSMKFLKTLKPEIAVCTNYIGKIYPNVKWNLTMVAKAPIVSTEHRNGIIASFTDTDEIVLTQNIM
ncbi:MAG: MBL fold metallo-hydrolase [Clostridia bacterium]|nr:MBL fold metallo-hydrolase [Clostridia bacterium]